MKKVLTWILIAALLISCCGCTSINRLLGKTEEEAAPAAGVFPDGVTICGADVSGMTPAEAAEAVAARAASYVLTLAVDGTEIPVSAEEMGLACGETDYEAILQGCLEDESRREIVVENLITYDEAKLEAALKEKAGGEEAAKNACIEYSEKEQEFVIVPAEEGDGINVTAVLEAVKAVIPALQPTVELDRETAYQPAELTEDSEEVQAALKKANDTLNLELTYTYAPEGAEAATETIGKELIAKWLVIEDDGLTVSIDPGPLNEYVTQMDEAHSIASSTSKFKTTGGSYIDVRVPSAGQTVDVDKLYNDIFDCLTNGISGEREAPYVEQEGDNSANFGGNYVEVDLSSQHVWVYNGGTCVVSTDIVSGCVNTGHATPTGLYTIQSRETDRYLVGPGYKSWVNFWMPFNGGIGLHDASWRWSFGGTIYYYSGSHGCINMPYSAAQATYQNVSVGTHVVVYGGTSSVSALQNSLGGTGSYTVTEGDAAFTLDAAPYYSTTLSYSSSNPAVVTVSAGGVVTIVGPGTATITVTAAAKEGYTSATKTVTVTVQSKCSTGAHSWDGGTVTKAATCAAEGVMTYTCTACGQTRTEAIPATGAHSWDAGVVTLQPTCVAKGIMTYTCTTCGATKTEEIPMVSHSYDEGGNCTVCGAKDPNYVPPEVPAP